MDMIIDMFPGQGPHIPKDSKQEEVLLLTSRDDIMLVNGVLQAFVGLRDKASRPGYETIPEALLSEQSQLPVMVSPEETPLVIAALAARSGVTEEIIRASLQHDDQPDVQ